MLCKLCKPLNVPRMKCKVEKSARSFRKIVEKGKLRAPARRENRKKLFGSKPELSLSILRKVFPVITILLSTVNLFNALNGQLRRLNCFVKSLKAPSWFLFVFYERLFLILSPFLSSYSRRQRHRPRRKSVRIKKSMNNVIRIISGG